MNHATVSEFAHEKISAFHAEADAARLARSVRRPKGAPGLLRRSLLTAAGLFLKS